MKKFVSLACLAACASAFAAHDVMSYATADVLAPTAISANSTNVTEFAFTGSMGRCAVCITAKPEVGRTVSASIYGRLTTNDVWSLVSAVNCTSTNAVAIRVPFIGDYAPPLMKLEICPKADTTAGAFVIGAQVK